MCSLDVVCFTAMTILDVAPVTLSSGGTLYPAIEFGFIEGFRPLQLDLYLPKRTSAPSPVIVYFHGGGWAVGTRRRFGRAFKSWSPSALARLAAAGFAVITVDYRLSGEATFPAQIDDAKAAVRWLRANAEELHVDVDRIVAWGESAGGQLAALLGVTGHRDTADDVCAVISWYAPMDLRNGSDPDSAESKMLGGTAIGRPGLAAAASPITHVHPAAPPFHIQHGDADELVSIGQSERMVEALRDAGVPVVFKTIEGSDHFWTGAPDLEAIFTESLDFAVRITSC
jgi:acetyl esterase/lipase